MIPLRGLDRKSRTLNVSSITREEDESQPPLKPGMSIEETRIANLEALKKKR